MSSNLKIDINADVGEGLGNEMSLMPYLSSCNIACGGHAGDFETMKAVVRLAKKHQVKIGAHPSFPDKENFGRLDMKLTSEVLFDSLKYQVEDLLIVLKSENLEMHHIKPHGALYNLAAKDEEIAKVILEVITSFSKPLKLYAPYNSVISKLAKQENIEVVFEGFADRNYNEDLSLVSRQKKDALITKKDTVFQHVFKMISEQKVNTINGVEVDLIVDTVCVHGDTTNASVILEYLHRNLKANTIKIL
ncbi:lactam utilization protein LamB [Winogradskyella sp. PC-19]|uniref:5-oxoprolinase subunit PxpA n=1 Tax=unclassified Winogradskyella TaxID=2615021 RepID=UPI000B3C9F85|nr:MULTISPECIES: 5-oxoprolinase subunit PxpA [unclassified Winogradskyella]ARV08801.1 lactam utilization protein LamB [Winogradskyella sp. PC-19]